MDLSVGVLFQFFLLISTNFAALQSPHYCLDEGAGTSSVCGMPMEYPLQLQPVSNSCGYPGFVVDCLTEYGLRAFINISNHIYYVIDVRYEGKQMRLVDVETERSECAQPTRNFSFPSSPSWVSYHISADQNVNITVFYNCSNVPADANQHLLCSQDYYKTTNSSPSYTFYNNDIPNGSDWYRNCADNVVIPIIVNKRSSLSHSDAIKLGFYMEWSAINWCGDCERSGGQCWQHQNSTGCACKNNKSYNRICPPLPAFPPRHEGMPPPTGTTSKSQHRKEGMTTGLEVMIGVLGGIGGLVLVASVIFCGGSNHFFLRISRCWKKNRSPVDVEAFLERYGCLSLQRYKYTSIKKMTNSFKDTLGQGGYGKVFKGKLHDGRVVAVKVLNESKGDGVDFVNEVATIGKTNHVNVVNLIGFCIDGSRRALVYEFMPNGSLERFIYTRKESTINTPLGWEKLYNIALGVARGLEYLHRGCNTRILHFDIKPHNILLDQDFNPKISDFGLAKLYPTRDSIVSTVGARGTMGYIAPELYCRNFGNVSHKSDVYSYGMMLLEMIGGRKNIDTTVENISEIYFPFWVYNHLMQNNDAKDLEDIQASMVFEDETTKKMIIVALWCIQMHPTERPSMSKVIEMLEGDIHDLEMPPNPSLDPRPRSSSSL